MDIWNSRPRTIICTKNGKDDCLVANENNHLLEVGKEYTLCDVEIHSWHTLVWVAEIPGIEFNSVLFEELDGYEEE